MKEIIDALVQFRDDREWSQFHDPRNLALALSIEAAELNEHFLWKKDSDADKVDMEGVKEELADVFAYAFLMAHRCGFDVEHIVMEKIGKNAFKYPIEKSKGTATKYDQL